MEDDRNPFSDLVTVDWSFLGDSSSRTKCPKCNKSRMYYCYSCCIPLPHIQDRLPSVKLPLKVDIIKHPKELDGKSTAPHASILAPDDVTIHTYPCIPDYNRDEVVVVFPGEGAISLDELKSIVNDTDEIKYNVPSPRSNDGNVDGEKDLPFNESSNPNGKNNFLKSVDKDRDPNTSDKPCNGLSQNEITTSTGHPTHDHDPQSPNIVLTTQSDSTGDLKRKQPSSEEEEERSEVESSAKHLKTSLRNCPFERVIFIDCTWNQTKHIVNDERLKGLRKVELKSQFTKFWRSQDGMPKTYLSTIEAIYFFFKDFHSIFLDSEYSHDYDNLLLFFCFMYHKIKHTTVLHNHK